MKNKNTNKLLNSKKTNKKTNKKQKQKNRKKRERKRTVTTAKFTVQKFGSINSITVPIHSSE